MLISLVTPVLNGAATIERTLKSVCVQQGDFEHIVVDGGSTDATPEIVEQYQRIYPVRLVRKPDRSLYEGVWNGMQGARGDVLAYLNADDIYLPWTFGTVRSVMKYRPEVQWLTGIPSWYFENTGASMTNGFAPERLGGGIDTRRQGIAGVTITISTPPTRPVVGLSFSGVCR
jgi:glycosyltransferase involved in cell wall biosynthesis